MVAKSQADLDRSMSMARAELDTVQRRRDGIVGQLAALRDLMASFGVDQPPADSGDSRDQSTEGGGAAPEAVPASSRLPEPSPEDQSAQGEGGSAPTNGSRSEPAADQTQVLAPVRSQD
jgi:hypothetical protein